MISEQREAQTWTPPLLTGVSEEALASLAERFDPDRDIYAEVVADHGHDPLAVE